MFKFMLRLGQQGVGVGELRRLPWLVMEVKDRGHIAKRFPSPGRDIRFTNAGDPLEKPQHRGVIESLLETQPPAVQGETITHGTRNPAPIGKSWMYSPGVWGGGVGGTT
jgi:hypothetical protein